MRIKRIHKDKNIPWKEMILKTKNIDLDSETLNQLPKSDEDIFKNSIP